MPAWARRDDGIAIAVRVTPRAARDAFGAGTADHFAARLSAPPVDGAANAALVQVVAKAFGVAKGAVTMLGGETGRLKRLHVAGNVTTLAESAARLYEAAA